MIPGVDVISRVEAPPRTPPTDTGMTFLVGPTTSGDPVTLVHSMTEYTALLGDRSGGTVTYDAADVYFHEGGARLTVARTNASLAASSARKSKSDTAEADAAPAPAAVDTGVQAALDALSRDYGPGQILIADPTLAAVAANQSALTTHAAATNRVALLSTTDAADAATLIAAGTAAQADANGRYAALFAPSAIVPGAVAGVPRTVPYSAVAAGIISRNDPVYGAIQAAAGQWGQSVFALDVANRYTDTDYEALNDASVNMARVMFGGVRTYGFRTAVDAAVNPQWKAFTWARLNMAIVADAGAIAEHYVFSVLDGRGHTISNFGGDLTGMLLRYWNADALFGATPQEAFSVDVGPSVNTPTTIANGELHAVLTVRMSGMTEHVVIEIVKLATNETLPAVAA